MIWADRVRHDVATEVTAHVQVTAPANAASWSVRVVGGNLIEEISSAEPCWTKGGCWTPPVPGGQVGLQLWTTGPSAPYTVRLDTYTFAKIPTDDQATVREDDKQDIGMATPAIRALAPPVARLVILSHGAYCTGFLVSRDLILTNEHCIADETDALSAWIEFNYEQPRVVPERRYRVQQLEVVDSELDYAVLRISPEAGTLYGHLRIAPTPNLHEGGALALIQHPAGRRKMYVVADCVLDGINIRGTAPTHTDFGHTCDTLQGSSGAPVFQNPGSEVVGLHHWGFDPNGEPVNQAIHMNLILADIRTDKGLPALADEMVTP
jgi:V8-like Glu-specific endopeptidase